MEDAEGASTSERQHPLISHATDDIAVDGEDHTARGMTLLRDPKAFLVGELDGSYFFKPLSIYANKSKEVPQLRFRGVGEFVPLLLNILLGLQHMGISFGPIVLPAVILAFTFPPGHFGQQYTIQSAFIIAGLGSLLQCMHIKIPGTSYHIGTGMCSFLGNSLVFANMFVHLTAKIARDDGIPFEDAYGKVLGTAALCAVLYIGLTLIPRQYVQVLFPPGVTGCILILVGLDCLTRGIQYWGGGNDCEMKPQAFCQFNGDVHLPYGSPEYIGVGFMVVTILLLIHFYGSAFLRQNSVGVAVLIPYVLSMIATRDGNHYVTGDAFNKANPINFLWTDTYSLGVHKSAFLPVLGAFLVSYLHTTAVLTSTLEESKLDVTSAEANARIQGGLIGTAVTSLFAVLATGIPVIPIPENNSFISMSRVASRMAGISGSIVLILFGIFGHLLAIVHEIPIVIEGGIITPLSVMIILSGLRILMKESWNERTSTIMLYAFVFGLGNLLAHHFIDFGLWPLSTNPNDVVHTLQFSIISMIRVPYFLGGFVAVTLHLLLPADDEVAHFTLLQEAA